MLLIVINCAIHFVYFLPLYIYMSYNRRCKSDKRKNIIVLNTKKAWIGSWKLIILTFR